MYKTQIANLKEFIEEYGTRKESTFWFSDYDKELLFVGEEYELNEELARDYLEEKDFNFEYLPHINLEEMGQQIYDEEYDDFYQFNFGNLAQYLYDLDKENLNIEKDNIIYKLRLGARGNAKKEELIKLIFKLGNVENEMFELDKLFKEATNTIDHKDFD